MLFLGSRAILRKILNPGPDRRVLVLCKPAKIRRLVLDIKEDKIFTRLSFHVLATFNIPTFLSLRGGWK